jgi:hypothetical protein
MTIPPIPEFPAKTHLFAGAAQQAKPARRRNIVILILALSGHSSQYWMTCGAIKKAAVAAFVKPASFSQAGTPRIT